jgi:uncharacterized protein (TIGR02466 family)
MTRTDIFTYPIWQWNNLPIDNNKISNHAYTLRNKDPEHRNPEGHSKYSFKWKSYNLTKKDFLAFPETKRLMDLIFENAKTCFQELNPRQSVSLILDSCWFNIYPPGSHLESHPHPGNVLAGSYYPKVSQDCGDLVFFTPDVSTYYNFAAKYFHGRNNITAVKHYVPPVEGSLVIAPSNIQHAVKENKSEDDRISFSFNFGVIDTDTYTPNDRYF